MRKKKASYIDRLNEYESQKKILAKQNLSPEEYNRRIKEIADKLKV